MSKHFVDEFSSVKMMAVMLTTSLLLTGTTLALPADPPHVYDARTSHSFHPDPDEVHEPYDFTYTVRNDESGADFAHSEASDGASVRGSYTVLLPDGRRQTVTYVVDSQTGYTARVSYSGEAHRPATFGSPVIPTAKTYRPQHGF
ncbi:cuticle protein 19-like isoform X1 [Penaeus indicus]|uniref:cuticle protein 19-like isoform X1 n=1 Tax=Penaeus indicus TaxID=29960 RepID=UPI00300C7B81